MRSFLVVLGLTLALPAAALAQAGGLDAPRAAERSGEPATRIPDARGPRPPGTVRLRVVSDDPGTRLYQTEVVGQTSTWSGRGQPPPGVINASLGVLGDYRLLCEAPCVLDLAMGSYLFGVQEGEGRIRFRRGTIDNHVQITRSGVLRIDVPNTTFRRVLGALLMIGGGIGFGLAMQKIDSGAPLIATTVSTGTVFMIGLLALVFPVMPTVEYAD